MSVATPDTRTKPLPRWSVVRDGELLPALMARLPAIRRWVCVGPPLLASAANDGSFADARVPVMLFDPVIGAPSVAPIKLKLTLNEPARSPPEPPEFLATMELKTLIVPAPRLMPVPVEAPLVSLLKATVELLMVIVPAKV